MPVSALERFVDAAVDSNHPFNKKRRAVAAAALPGLFVELCSENPEWMARVGRCPAVEVRELEALLGWVKHAMHFPAGVTIATTIRELEAALGRARDAMTHQQGVLALALLEMAALEASCRTGKIRDTYGADALSQAVGVARCVKALRKHMAQ